MTYADDDETLAASFSEMVSALGTAGALNAILDQRRSLTLKAAARVFAAEGCKAIPAHKVAERLEDMAR